MGQQGHLLRLPAPRESLSRHQAAGPSGEGERAGSLSGRSEREGGAKPNLQAKPAIWKPFSIGSPGIRGMVPSTSLLL